MFTCTPIFHCYSEYDNIQNLIQVVNSTFRLDMTNLYYEFPIKTHGICEYYSGFRGILWTCTQHTWNIRLNHGFYSSLQPVYGLLSALCVASQQFARLR